MIAKWDKSFEDQGARNYDSMLGLLEDVLSECDRVLIQGGIVCLNIGDATRTVDKKFCCYPNAAMLTAWCFTSLGWTPLIPIYWKKISNRPNAFLGSGFLPVNAYVSQDCEYILIFRKGKLRKFSEDSKVRREESKFTREERDTWFQQVWEIPGARGAGKTSCWPEEIPYRLLRMFSIKGDTILDPFAGSGFESLCEQYGRIFIGYEIEEE